MVNVFVLIDENINHADTQEGEYPRTDAVGVFSSLEKAQAKANDYDMPMIEEFTLDGVKVAQYRVSFHFLGEITWQYEEAKTE
jgi:hypothetical protein